VEDAPDGRRRRHPVAVASEVPGDRHRPGIEAAGGELEPQLDDPLADRSGRPTRTGRRPARARFEGVQAAVPVARQQPVQVLPADPVLGRGGRDGQLL
jgi:hypothetical protein